MVRILEGRLSLGEYPLADAVPSLLSMTFIPGGSYERVGGITTVSGFSMSIYDITRAQLFIPPLRPPRRRSQVSVCRTATPIAEVARPRR